MDRRAALELLHLALDATASDIRRARRRLAKGLHPDHGGDAIRMRELNHATATALAAIAEQPVPMTAAPEQATAAPETADSGARSPRPSAPRGPMWVVEDVPSFVVEALPAVTFELVSAVATQLGSVLDDDPPYALEVALSVPSPCWCRLEVIPEAGASSVNLYVGSTGSQPPPTVEAVRDLWVESLNAAEWPAGEL